MIIGENTARAILHNTPSFQDGNSGSYLIEDDDIKKKYGHEQKLGSNFGSNQVLEGGIEDDLDQENDDTLDHKQSLCFSPFLQPVNKN